MKRYATMAMAALAMVALGTTPALAQNRGGGQGPQMQGGMMMGMGMRPGGPMLLMHPTVQKELKMTEAQVEKLRDLLEQNRPQMGLRDGSGPGMGQGGRPGMGMGPGGRGERPIDGLAKQVLNPQQLARFRQLALQAEGLSALRRQDVADEVGLTAAQLNRVRKVLADNAPQRGGGMGPGGPGMRQGGPGGPGMGPGMRQGGPGGPGMGQGGPGGPGMGPGMGQGGPGGPGMGPGMRQGGPGGPGMGPGMRQGGPGGPGMGPGMRPGMRQGGPGGPGMGPGMRQGGPGGPGMGMQGMGPMRQRIDAEIRPILTERQVAKWKTMLGKELKLGQAAPPPPPEIEDELGY